MYGRAYRVAGESNRPKIRRRAEQRRGSGDTGPLRGCYQGAPVQRPAELKQTNDPQGLPVLEEVVEPVVNPITIEDVLDYCLANPDNLSNEELLTKFPQYAVQLQPLLTLGVELGDMVPPQIPAERRGAMKQRIVAAAAARQAARPMVPVAAPARRGLIIAWPRFAWAGAAVAAMLVLFVWWASSRALPGNALYGVK